MSQITSDLNMMKEQDVYSLILYAIYKCTEDKDYAIISELIYTFDKSQLFRFCSVFGGTTIKVPTIDELKIYISALLVYDLMNKGKDFNSAFKETGLELKYKKEVASIYTKLSGILDEFGK